MENQHPVPAVLLKMEEIKDELTRSEIKIMDIITRDPEKTIYASITELAAECRVSEPTVIRFCRKLGLAGYQDLKLSLARDMVSPRQSINREISEDDDAAVVIGKIFESTRETLRLTEERLSLPDLQRAAEILAGAGRIIGIGVGNSHAVCIDFQHKMLRLNLDVASYTDPHMAAISLSHAGTKDVLFCISHSGSSKEIVDLAAQARENHVTIISLTSAGSNPLSKLSTVTLHTFSNETRYSILGRESRIAELAIIDSLYTLIALGKDDRDFLSVETALKSHKY